MKAIDLFMPHILPACPGASQPAAEQALRDSAYEFCERTDIVQRVLTATSVAGTKTVSFTAPTDMQALRIRKAFYGPTPLVLQPTGDVENILAISGTVDGYAPDSGTPTEAFLIDPQTCVLAMYPVPDAAKTVSVRMSFAPTRAAAQLDDVLYDQYITGVCAGAIARLMMTPSQQYTADPTAYRMMFEAEVAHAKMIARRGRVTASRFVSPRNFA